MGRYITEFIGAFFLVLTIGLAVATQQLLASLAIGGVLMVTVYMGGHLSGAHYNPAVTLAVFLAGKMPSRDVVPYMLMQIAGAIVAAVFAVGLTGSPFSPAPAPGVSAFAAVAVEFLFTLALALVMLNVAASPDTEGNSYFGLAIGATLGVGVIAGGPISGAAFNPAVAIGPSLVSAVMGAGLAGHIWIYLVGPFLGGMAAAAIFRSTERSRIAQGRPVGAESIPVVPPQSAGEARSSTG